MFNTKLLFCQLQVHKFLSEKKRFNGKINPIQRACVASGFVRRARKQAQYAVPGFTALARRSLSLFNGAPNKIASYAANELDSREIAPLKLHYLNTCR